VPFWFTQVVSVDSDATTGQVFTLGSIHAGLSVPFSIVVRRRQQPPTDVSAEVIRVTAKTGAQVTACTRNYKSTGAFAMQPGDEAYQFFDPIALATGEPSVIFVDGSVAYPQTRAGVQAAIDALSSAGGLVVVPSGVTITSDGTPITLTKNNSALLWRPGSVLKAPATAGSLNLIEWGTSTLTEISAFSGNVAVGDLTVGLSTVSGLAVGDYYEMIDPTLGNRQAGRVLAISGTTVRLSEPAQTTFLTANTAKLYKFATPLVNSKIIGLRAEINGNTGTTTCAVRRMNAVRCRLDDFYGYGFNGDSGAVSGSAFISFVGYRNEDGLVVAELSGGSQSFDLIWSAESFSSVQEARSYNSGNDTNGGFAIGIDHDAASRFERVMVAGTGGRGVKVAQGRFTSLGHVRIHGTSVYGATHGGTGMSFTDGCQDCHLDDLEVMGSPAAGLWFSDQTNVRNRIGLVVAVNNNSGAVGASDIELNATDTDNVITTARYGSLNDLGARNFINGAQGGIRKKLITAMEFVPRAAAGQAPANSWVTNPDARGTNSRYEAWVLANAANNFLVAVVQVPENWKSGAITFYPWYTGNGTFAGNWVCSTEFKVVSDGSDLNATAGADTATLAVPANAANVKTLKKDTPLATTLTPSAAGQSITIVTGRLGSDGADSCTDSIEFMGLEMRYAA